MPYLVGIDVGTSGTKAVLFDLSGQIVASASAEYPLYQPQNGWAEQEPEDWWRAVCTVLSAVTAAPGVRPGEILGVGLSGQMHGLVMLDADGRVLRRSIIWCDQRTARECEEITERVGKKRLIELTANPALTGFTASKIRWVQRHEPELYRQCRHILLPKDYIRYKLTGVFATEVSDASGMQLLDVPRRCWSQEVLDALGIDRALLGEVYESPDVTGTVTPQAAKQTGLAAGTPVVGGAGDNAAAAVGTATVRQGRAFTTIGTSGVVFAHTASPVIDPAGRVHTFCCAVPGAWHMMGVTQAAGLSLKWFKNNFCQEELQQAEREGKNVYALLDEEAARVPVGSERLLYLPYLMGERTPHLDPDCRGVFFGLSGMHTRAHLLRAVMEGVGFSLLDCMTVLREAGVQPVSMMACGGGGSSALWRQMLADLYGCPVQTTASQENAALGAAILAGTGAGVFASVEQGCDRLVQIDQSCSPQPEQSEQYRRVYPLYRSLYQSLAPEFQKLAAL